MSNFTTDPAAPIKAQVRELVEELLKEAEIPATFVTLTALNNNDTMLMSIDIPHSVGDLPQVAYLVDAAFSTDVELYSISLWTCECYAVTLRVHVKALLAVVEEMEDAA